MGKILLWFILVFLIVSMIFTFTLSGCKDWRNFGKDAGKDAGPGEIDAGPGEIDAGPGEIDAGPGEIDAGK